MDIFRYIIYRYTKFIKAHPKLIRREHGKDEGWWMAWVPATGFNQIAFSIIIYILAIIIVIFHEILQYKAFWWVVAIFSFALVMYLDNYIEKRVKDKREFKESSTMFYNDPHYKLKGWLISLFLALPYPLLFVIAIHWWD